MKVIQVIPAFRLAGAEVMCENLCVALKDAGVDVIAVSLYSENTAITDRLDKKGVHIEYLDKKPGFDASIIMKLVHLFKIEKPDQKFWKPGIVYRFPEEMTARLQVTI